jgi:hypothetical protein
MPDSDASLPKRFFAAVRFVAIAAFSIFAFAQKNR